MSTKDTDPAQDPKQASLLTGDAAAQAADASAASVAGAQEAAPVQGAQDAAQSAASADTHADAPIDASVEASVEAPPAAAADAAATTSGEATEVEGESVGDTAAAEPEIPGQLPGELLAARRIEMRLSIEELSARVKLAPRQLIALEANDFGALPGMATTRGFIRSCAKSMGMDPEPLLAMLAQEPNPALGPMVMRRPLPQPGFNGRRYGPSTSHRRGANKLMGLAAVVLIFVGMLAYVAWRNDWLHLPSLDLSSARDAVTATSPAPDAEAPAAEAGTTTEPSANTQAAPAAPASTVASTAASTAAAPADAEVYAPAAPAPVAPAAGANAGKAELAKPATAASSATIDPTRALELKLREDSWVEVLTQNGERKLMARLVKAGSIERIEVTEPLILVVGNAAGVDVTLRGQPVSLKAGTRDNVAKVNLK